MSPSEGPQTRSLSLSQILRHTRALLPQDAANFRADLSNLQNDSSQLQSRIETLLSELSVLQTRHKNVSAALQATKSLFAPIHALPNEVLLHIFRLCLPETKRDSCLDLGGVRFCLAAVCGWWRDLVLQAPWLWTTLAVNFEKVDNSMTQALGRFLELSRDLPLDVFIRAGSSFRCQGPEAEDRLAAMGLQLSQHSHRWRTFDLYTYVDTRFMFAKAPIQPDFSALEELSIWRTSPKCSRHYLSLMSPGLPNVRRLSHSPALGDDLDLNLSHPNLTHLSLRPTTESSPLCLADVLRRHEALTEVIIVTNTSNPQPLGDLVEHKSLEHLVLSAVADLQHVKLPSLKSLVVSLGYGASSSSTETKFVIDFLHRSQCRLDSLSIYAISAYSLTAVTTMISSCSDHLVHLRLILVDDHLNTVLKVLSHTTDASGQFPHLKSLEITVKKFHDSALLTELVDMLRSRRDQKLAARWKTDIIADVALDISHLEYLLDEERESFSANLRTLRQGGLHFWWTSHLRIGWSHFSLWSDRQERVPMKLDTLYDKERRIIVADWGPVRWSYKAEEERTNPAIWSDDDFEDDDYSDWGAPQIAPHQVPSAPVTQVIGNIGTNGWNDVSSIDDSSSTDMPVIPPSPGTDFASDSGAAVATLGFEPAILGSPSSPSQFPSPFNHPLPHFAEGPATGVPTLVEGDAAFTQSQRFLLQEVDGEPYADWGGESSFERPLSPLLLSEEAASNS